MRSRSIGKKFVAVMVTAVTLFSLVGCGLASSKINELCLVYSGGITEDAKFEKLLEPGSNNNSIGVGSDTYCYKIDQRSYIANSDKGKGDTGPVEVVSSDTVKMAVEYQFYFTLNQDENVVKEFHENLGVKTEAWTEEGWNQLLQEYFEPQIERALEAAALKFSWKDLYSSESTRKEFQDTVVATVKANLKEVIGNDYFCGPKYTKQGDKCGDFTFTVGKPYPLNEGIVSAVESQQKAAANTGAQDQKNRLIEEEAKGKRTLVDLYGQDNAALIELCSSVPNSCKNIIVGNAPVAMEGK